MRQDTLSTPATRCQWMARLCEARGPCSQCRHEELGESLVKVLLERETGAFRSVMMQRRAVGHTVRSLVAQQGTRDYRRTFETKATHAPELQSFAVFDRLKRYHRIDGSYDFHLLDGGIDLQDLWESPARRAAAIAGAIDEEESLPRSSSAMGFEVLRESLCGMVSFSSCWATDCRDDQCGVPRSHPLNKQEEGYMRSHSCIYSLSRPVGRRRGQQQLYCHSARSGRCLFRTKIDPMVNYIEIGWNTYLNSFWCISSQKSRSVAVFAEAQPFRLLTKFCVTKEGFGPLGKVEGVNVTLDVLCLAYKLEKFVLYSLPELISRYSIREPASAATATGYLDTLSIQERATPIRVVQCGGQMIYQMPYLLSYDSSVRYFSLVHIRSNEEVDMSAVLKCLPASTERSKFQFEDTVKMFAYDHMQRFVLKQATRLDFFSVASSPNGRRLIHLHTIVESHPFKRSEGDASDCDMALPRLTSSGRAIPSYNGSGTKTHEEVLGVDYEDDLDVITVTMRKGCFMYSNSDGRFLRYVPLGPYWAATGINVAVVDCTTLVFLTGKEHRIGTGGDFYYRVMALQECGQLDAPTLQEEELLVRNEAEVDAFDGENDSDFDPDAPF